MKHSLVVLLSAAGLVGVQVPPPQAAAGRLAQLDLFSSY